MGASLFLTWVEFVGRNGFDNLLIPIAVGLVFPLILHEELFGWAALGAGGVGMAGLLLSTSFRAMIHHFVVRLFLRSQIS
jgi:hypothetical protein